MTDERLPTVGDIWKVCVNKKWTSEDRLSLMCFTGTYRTDNLRPEDIAFFNKDEYLLVLDVHNQGVAKVLRLGLSEIVWADLIAFDGNLIALIAPGGE